MIRLSVLAILPLALLACSSTPPAETKEEPLRGTISLASGPCTGLCPVYRMSVTPDDRYRLNAEEHTINPGRSQGALPVNSFRRALEALEEFDVASMQRFYTRTEPDSCPDWISDLPTIDISRVDGETRQIVTVDTGCVGYEDRDRIDRLVERLRDIFRIRDLVAVGEAPKPSAKTPPTGE